jgi:hypothetical protein
MKLTNEELRIIVRALDDGADWKDDLAQAYGSGTKERKEFSAKAKVYRTLRRKIMTELGLKDVDPFEGLEATDINELRKKLKGDGPAHAPGHE